MSTVFMYSGWRCFCTCSIRATIHATENAHTHTSCKTFNASVHQENCIDGLFEAPDMLFSKKCPLMQNNSRQCQFETMSADRCPLDVA